MSNNIKLNNLKNFIKDQERYIKARNEFIHKNINDGLYPEKFSFPLGIQFELTSQCNLYCKHCYNRSSSDRLPLLNKQNWEDIVKDIINNGGIFQCILSGGEPLLLGDDLFDIIDPLHNDGTGFILITNGYLVNERFIEKLKKYDFFWVQVSIDHFLPNKHDEFRGKIGSWEKAVNAALLFSSAGFPLRIAHTLTPTSIEYLNDFAELSFQLGASSLVCGQVMLSGRVDNNRDLLCNEYDLDKIYYMINDLRNKYAGKMEIYGSQDEVIANRSHKELPNTSIIIRPDGDVRLDCTMPFTIGNVLNKPFSSIWKEKGSVCWNNPRITEYIDSLELDKYNIKHINHVTPDIKI